MSYQAILWPTDGSSQAIKSLETAVKMAETFKAELYALHAVYPVPVLTTEGYMPPAPMTFNVPEYEKELLKQARENLDKSVKENVTEGIKVKKEIRSGEPPEVIIEFVREKKVDLIVMATHGRKGMSHLFLGSVAEKVIRNSPVEVLIVPITPKE